MEYINLESTNSDRLIMANRAASSKEMWVIRNNFPTELFLYLEDPITGKTALLSKISPRGTISFPPERIRNGSKLYTMYLPILQKELQVFIPPFTVRDYQKHIVLGSIVYKTGSKSIDNINADINGIHMYNMTAMPLNVYYKGNLAAQLYPNDDKGYLGGGISSLYFTNDRQGLNFGDEITFTYATREKQQLFTAVLDDEYCEKMYIGVVSDTDIGPVPDQAIYSVMKPVYTSVKFY